VTQQLPLKNRIDSSMAGTNQLSAYSAALNSSASGEATQLRNQSFRLGAKLLV